jgi:hypothetical protein
MRLAPSIEIYEGRNLLKPRPKGYIVGLVIGSDDGRARRYDVHLNWNGLQRLDSTRKWNADEAFASIKLEVTRA